MSFPESKPGHVTFGQWLDQTGRASGYYLGRYLQYRAITQATWQITQFIDKFTQDQILARMQESLPAWLAVGWDFARDFAAAGPTGRMDLLKSELSTQMNDLWWLKRAGAIAGMGTALASAAEPLYGTGQLIHAYKTLMYNAAVLPRIHRRFNQYYRPNYLSSAMGWVAWRRGLWDKKKYYEAGSFEGWSDEQMEISQKLMSSLPSANEAFYMWQKGTLTEDKFKELMFAGGFDPEWYDAMIDNWYYTPTLYDITRMADYVELDQTWTVKALKRRGMKDDDIAKIWKYLEARPIRSDVQAIQNRWVWRYQYGRATLNELTEALTELGVKPKAKELLIEKAQLLFEDELVDEWTVILQWRFRTARITDEEFLSGLISIGIRIEKANLIVETEKAKGYLGGYY